MAALTKFVYPPDNSSYSVADGKSVVATQLDGGAMRYRRAMIGATSTVACTWIVGPEGYKYIRAFFLAISRSGSLPFAIDLLLDQPELTEHKAYFIPDTMTLANQKGLQYTVTAKLEVYPIENDMEADAIFVSLFSEFGPNYVELFPKVEDEFDTLMNISIPGALYA